MSAITECLFRFYGNAAVKRKVAQWRRILKPFENPAKQFDDTKPICENDDEYNEEFRLFQKGVEALLIQKCVEIFGIKLNHDLGRYIEYQGDFHFFCDRYSISELRFLLLKALIPFDKDVVVEYFYDFESDFGYHFVAIGGDGNVIEKSFELYAFTIDYDEHGEIFFDEGNDDGEPDISQQRLNLVEYYQRRILDIKFLRKQLPSRADDLGKREKFVKKRLKIALAKRSPLT